MESPEGQSAPLAPENTLTNETPGNTPANETPENTPTNETPGNTPANETPENTPANETPEGKTESPVQGNKPTYDLPENHSESTAPDSIPSYEVTGNKPASETPEGQTESCAPGNIPASETPEDQADTPASENIKSSKALFDREPADSKEEDQESDSEDASAGLFYTSLVDEVYLAQKYDHTCTLAAAAMMIRARLYLSNNPYWKYIDEDAIYSVAWAPGLYWSFTYSYGNMSVSVSRTGLSGISVSSLKAVLNEHPEGVVLYVGGTSYPHAVFLTDYEGDVFYCADSGYNSNKRIRLEESYLGWIGSQSGILAYVTDIWYISSYRVGNETEGLSLNCEEAMLPTGRSFSLIASVGPVDSSGKKVLWSSSDSSVASVDEKGLVTAKRYGSCTITATMASDRSVKATCRIQTLFYDAAGSNVRSSADYQYFYNAVYWAAERGITKGYDQVYFGTGLECQRREMMIFLWRLAGKPDAPAGTVMSFNDLDAYQETSDTYKAILWAVGSGITKGYSDGGFHPTDPITRKDTMILLYRFAGKPEPEEAAITFPDVLAQNYPEDSDTYRAILWGTQAKITAGYADGNFQPLSNCLREQIVTFLYRYGA